MILKTQTDHQQVSTFLRCPVPNIFLGTPEKLKHHVLLLRKLCFWGLFFCHGLTFVKECRHWDLTFFWTQTFFWEHRKNWNIAFYSYESCGFGVCFFVTGFLSRIFVKFLYRKLYCLKKTVLFLIVLFDFFMIFSWF